MTGREEWEDSLSVRLSNRVANYPEYIQGYYASLLNIAYSSRETYLSLVLKCLKSIGKEPMDITKNDILIFMSNLKRNDGGRLSDANKALTHSAIKSFFSYLYDEEDPTAPNAITKNPMNKVSRPKAVKKHRDIYLTKEEVDLYVKNVATQPHRWKTRNIAIVQTLLLTGMREGALLGLNMEDVDFDKATITVTTKGNKTQEFIVPTLMPSLKRWVDVRNTHNNPTTHALFLSAPNKRLKKDALSKMLGKYAQGATDKHVTAHVFRHTFGTLLYQETGDIKLVQDCLGHENIETTTIYTNIDTNKTGKASSIMSGLFNCKC